MTETPLKQQAKPSNVAEKSLWEQVLNDFLPKRLIKREEKQAGVVLSREYDVQRGTAVWTKIYEDRKDGESLSIFNEWESILISRLKSAGVSKCYQLVESSIVASRLNQPGQTTIRTRHVGPDLNRLCRRWDKQRLRWSYLKLWGNRKPIAHPFVAPANYLKLAKGTLEALEQLHQKSEGFVHCDLNPGNLALTVRAEMIDTARGEALCLTPDWDHPFLIDFGYSLCRAIQPLTTLPLDPASGRLSEHLRDCLNQIEADSKKKHRLTDQLWEEKRFDKSFWSSWRDNALSRFRTIDWREDIFQLGFLLREIRDEWGGGELVQCSNHHDMNSLIWNLPEQMLTYGEASEVGTPEPTNLPHRAWIQAIDHALVHADRADGFEQMILYRADHDEVYAFWIGLLHYQTLAGIMSQISPTWLNRKLVDSKWWLAWKWGVLVMVITVVLAAVNGLTQFSNHNKKIINMVQPPPVSLKLECPSELDRQGMATFESDANALWLSKQKNENNSAAVWQATRDGLASAFSRKKPSTQGANEKTKALQCLGIMSKLGDADAGVKLEEFKINYYKNLDHLWEWQKKAEADDRGQFPVELFKLWKEDFLSFKAAGYANEAHEAMLFLDKLPVYLPPNVVDTNY